MKRSIAIIIHILSVLVIVAGLASLRSYTIESNGIGWIRESSFEDSLKFAQMVDDDIGALKRYAVLKEAFEDDGQFSDQKLIITADTTNGKMAYTVGDIVSMANRFGYSLDESTHGVVAGSSSPGTNNYQIRISSKLYDPYYFDNIEPGPSQGVMYIKDACIEVLKAMSEYYSLKSLYDTNQTNFKYYALFSNNESEEMELTNVDISTEEIKALDKYIILKGDYSVTTNISPQPQNLMPDSATFSYYPVDQNEDLMVVGVDTAYIYADRYKSASYSFGGYIERAYYFIGTTVAALLLAVITLVLIVRGFGTDRSREKEIDRMPFEVMVILCAIMSVVVYFVFRMALFGVLDILAASNDRNFWCVAGKTLVVYGFCVVILCSMYRRSVNGGVFENSLSNSAVEAVFNSTTGNVAWRTFGHFAAFMFINALGAGLTVMFATINPDSRYCLMTSAVILVLTVLFDIFVFVKICGEAVQKNKLRLALRRVSEGKVDESIDETEFTGNELDMARSINSISDGLSRAVSEQVKADRLKADLITNVSHDIKTPLTSIINYVDLIKREQIDNDRIREYVDVLDRKSKRLKNLTEDLVEASKASSGNIKMDMQRIDMAELAGQAAGEFEDKFKARSLEFELELPDEPAYIMADGRHLWRVFENLFNNAAKYAMEHTRVYSDVSDSGDGEQWIFTIKNVSADKLNISPEELTERFVRGDVSRTTEGSGLGLSIAKSLAALMQGKLVIEIDGDLYKARVVFKKCEAAEQADAAADGSEAGAGTSDVNRSDAGTADGNQSDAGTKPPEAETV